MGLKIKSSLLILLFTILFLSFISNCIIFSVLFQAYCMMLNKVVAENLMLSMKDFELKVEKIEYISKDIMTDRLIQEKIKAIKTCESPYEKYQLSNEISDILSLYYSSDNYVKEIYISDQNGNEIRLGCEEQKRIEGLNEIIGSAQRNDGKNVWIKTSDQDSLISARKIRDLSALSLNNLGTLILNVDVKRIIKNTVDSMKAYSAALVILLSNEVAVSSGKDFYDFDFSDYIERKESYQIFRHNKEKYFMTFANSNRGSWTYIAIIPYNEIYRKVISMKIYMLAFYFAILAVFLFLGIRITRNITQPIEHLASMLKKIEMNNFELNQEIEKRYKSNSNEIGTLYREFEIMLGRISTLINENYKKQLIVKDSQFKTLQAQINPHFLYNTLESINWVAKVNDQKEIATMTKSLGNILRSSISKRNYIITIEEEMKLIDDYLAIQKIRYEERLQYNIHISSKIKQFAIPKLILQPIVENAIKYGLEILTGTCSISLKASQNSESISIAISDNGPGIRKEYIKKIISGDIATKGSGVGLKNIIERLELVYGPKGRLEISSKRGQGTTVTLIIPMLYTSDLADVLRDKQKDV